ncbi:MAG: RimK family alpha-L-glutamate ligase [Lachnospiraceae bacterium]|jgi:ribosomal protein S6--L-glutamate ligase/tetrahydromethanopterin:alpha-L-glutamate ligase|nr:RimK family alpha-L-glutamate ligase [Lachnospiraceae bacterium]
MKKYAVFGNAFGWHSEQLLKAFAKKNIPADFVGIEQLNHSIGITVPKHFGETGNHALPMSKYGGILYRGIPSGSLEEVIYHMDALFALESAGVKIINSPKSIEKTVDKYLTLVLLENADLPVPPTCCCKTLESAKEAFYTFGEDVLYKPLFGSCGKGVARIKTETELIRVFETCKKDGRVFYLQKFIPSGNADLRAFVINGRIIASIKRMGKDWLSNISCGGIATPYSLSPYEEELSMRAAKAVSADIAGVDLLSSEEGQIYVTEVNGCPGWKGLSAATGISISDEIVNYLISNT